MRQLVSVNPSSGMRTYHEWDDAAQEHVFINEIDRRLTQAVLKRNAEMRDQAKGKELRLAASIPPEVQLEWLDKHGVEFWNPEHGDKVKRLLNSNEYSHLRVWEGLI